MAELRKRLSINRNQIGDEGVAALVAPGEGVLPSLKALHLDCDNKIGDSGCASLVDALDSGMMPALVCLAMYNDEGEVWWSGPASEQAYDALVQACERRGVATQDGV